MTSKIQYLAKKQLIRPPKYVVDGIQYETMMGSVAYGVSTDYSDLDVYGFCIPPKHIIFPHVNGFIQGFGTKPEVFEQYQQHHILDKDSGKEYDFSIYNIVRYFQLCMENNPNMVDSLYTPQFCVQHSTRIGNMVREHRDLFLHKGSWYKYKGYAYSQLHKLKNKAPEGKRKELVDKFGYDVKFGYHVVRLLLEAQMILEEGTLDLQRHNEHLKAIRRGDVSEEDLRKWASDKESQLEKVYHSSKLQHSPDEEKIKQLLLDCLEEYFGSLKLEYQHPEQAIKALRDIELVLEKNKDLLK
jgi:predicted nucleotidyltransferase